MTLPDGTVVHKDTFTSYWPAFPKQIAVGTKPTTTTTTEAPTSSTTTTTDQGVGAAAEAEAVAPRYGRSALSGLELELKGRRPFGRRPPSGGRASLVTGPRWCRPAQEGRPSGRYPWCMARSSTATLGRPTGPPRGRPPGPPGRGPRCIRFRRPLSPVLAARAPLCLRPGHRRGGSRGPDQHGLREGLRRHGPLPALSRPVLHLALHDRPEHGDRPLPQAQAASGRGRREPSYAQSPTPTTAPKPA